MSDETTPSPETLSEGYGYGGFLTDGINLRHEVPFRRVVTDFPQKPVYPSPYPTYFSTTTTNPPHPLLAVLERIADTLDEIENNTRSAAAYSADANGLLEALAPKPITFDTTQAISYSIEDVKITDQMFGLLYGRPRKAPKVPETIFAEASDRRFDFDEIDWDLYDKLGNSGSLVPLLHPVGEALGKWVQAPEVEAFYVHEDDYWSTVTTPGVYADHIAEAAGTISSRDPAPFDGFFRLTQAGVDELLGNFEPVEVESNLLDEGVFIHLKDCWDYADRGLVGLGKWVAPISTGHLIYGEIREDGTKKSGAIWGNYGTRDGFYRIDEAGLRELGLR